ncbi:hypothetical protein ACJMK2_044100 [Sinanodonta woodiana]|uniref:G-protein coupled receptors family 1 profile domain-containing protein n=1 Tax=Sinanodonta woodiana TaxID=1069815 RepID=A0ABD3VYY3_SINWO
MALNSTTVSSFVSLLMTDNNQVTEQNMSVSPNYNPNSVTQVMANTSKQFNNENVTEFNLIPPSSHEVLVSISLLFCFIGSVGLLGNCLVVIVVLLDRKMRQSVTNIFIMNLAIADFLIMLFGVPEIVQFMINRGWLLGTVVCKTNRFILVVSLYVSILSLISVCIERYISKFLSLNIIHLSKVCALNFNSDSHYRYIIGLRTKSMTVFYMYRTCSIVPLLLYMYYTFNNIF